MENLILLNCVEGVPHLLGIFYDDPFQGYLYTMGKDLNPIKKTVETDADSDPFPVLVMECVEGITAPIIVTVLTNRC